MLMTWHTVALEKVQLQVRALSNPFGWLSFTHPDCPLHGSTLKSQSVVPNLFAISRKPSTAKVTAQINKQVIIVVDRKRKGYPNPTNQTLELHRHE